MKITVDTDSALITIADPTGIKSVPFADPEAFNILSRAWLRCGWDAKYVYSFTWMGRPIIQLPEDMLRLQEVIYAVKPDVIVETGVAHGGSLVFYAGLFRAMGRGRVIGVDVEIRPHNRAALEAHELHSMISLIEGDSTAKPTADRVRAFIRPNERVMVCLDSNHRKAHVLAELSLYAPLVTKDSYIVVMDGIMGDLPGAPRSVMDGIMGDLPGAPRSQPDWAYDNPKEAAREFVVRNPSFVIEEPAFRFNEGIVNRRVTYWPDAFLRRIA
jgi:cephalosporin hydroxylase